MSRNINDLRDALFDALHAVKAGTMPLDQARQINEVAKTIVETAKVEVEYLRVTGETHSTFIDTTDVPDGIVSITRHRLKG